VEPICVKIAPYSETNATQMERLARFGPPGPMRDRLISAVFRGEKTATTSLLAELAANQEALPTIGERLTVVDSDDRPVAVIELTAVEVIALGDVALDLAKAEAEGFESVAEWREAHERFWSDEVIPELPDGLTLRDDTEVVIERFRLVATG
jgi:uncharacterized protein YhfF